MFRYCSLQDSWVPNNLWQTASSQPQQQGNLLAPQAAPGSAEDVDLVALAPPVSTATVATGTEEKAIVLYKPVNPPLFPGGPPAGSSDPAFVVDTAGYLAACKGTGNNGSSSDAGHSSSAFASSSSDISWTGLFEGSPLYFLVGSQGVLQFLLGGPWLARVQAFDKADSGSFQQHSLSILMRECFLGRVEKKKEWGLCCLLFFALNAHVLCKFLFTREC